MKNKNDTAKPRVTGIAAALTENKAADQKAIDNHLQAAEHHAAAAKHHNDAAAFYKAGNTEKAAHSAMLAYGHHTIAGEFISDDAKHHAQVLNQTNYGF